METALIGFFSDLSKLNLGVGFTSYVPEKSLTNGHTLIRSPHNENIRGRNRVKDKK